MPILARLDRLSAPPVLRPSLIAERRALRRSVALSAAVEAALAKRDARAVTADIRALSGLAAGPAAVRTRRDQIAAARAYNRRLAKISALARKIDRERQTLVQALG